MISEATPSSMMQPAQSVDSRRERRVAIKSIVLPFLGSRTNDYSPFQYLLSDLSPRGAKILIPNWLIRREWLHKGEEVDVHAPFLFEGETYFNGEIAWERRDDEYGGQACGIHFTKKMPSTYPVTISFEKASLEMDLTNFSSAGNLMLLVLKDAILLKRGISIYLKHLAPYLSRISGVDKKEYAFLRHFLIEDGVQHVNRNREHLEAVYQELLKGSCSQEEVASCVNIEMLMQFFEPEIPADVFSVAFYDESVAPYVRSIKALEKKLYYSYNTLMLLYIQSI